MWISILYLGKCSNFRNITEYGTASCMYVCMWTSTCLRLLHYAVIYQHQCSFQSIVDYVPVWLVCSVLCRICQELQQYSKFTCFICASSWFSSEIRKQLGSRRSFVSSDSGLGLVAGSYEHGNEHSSSMKEGKLLNYLKVYQLLQKNSAPRSWYSKAGTTWTFWKLTAFCTLPLPCFLSQWSSAVSHRKMNPHNGKGGIVGRKHLVQGC